MSVVVTRSKPVVVVGSPAPARGVAAAGIMNLSSFDRSLVPIPVTLLLVFDKRTVDPVETIRTALSEALVLYYPMAGRLAAGDDGELHIACTGEGVSFVGASADSALDHVEMSPPLMRDLAACYPSDLCGLSDALLLMQVTEFTCGGFIVGVTWNHIIADAAGMAQFLQAVGELARGMRPPSVVPVRVDASLPCLPTPTSGALRSQVGFETQEMAHLDVTVPSGLISRIRAEYGSDDCTVFEVVAAVLWRCRTRAVMTDSSADPDEDPAVLAFDCNVRGLVGAKHGYYGNCVTMQLVQSKMGRVASSDIKGLVKLIQLSKEKIPDLLKISGREQDAAGAPPAASSRYNTLSVTSWRNLGLDGADYGCGTPARVVWYAEKIMALPCVVCPPCKGKDGVNVLSLCVKPEHAHAFLGELADLTM